MASEHKDVSAHRDFTLREAEPGNETQNLAGHGRGLAQLVPVVAGATGV